MIANLWLKITDNAEINFKHETQQTASMSEKRTNVECSTDQKNNEPDSEHQSAKTRARHNLSSERYFFHHQSSSYKYRVVAHSYHQANDVHLNISTKRLREFTIKT